MRSGFLVTLSVTMCTFGVNAVKVTQDDDTSGFDTSDLMAMLGDITPNLTVNAQDAAPSVIAPNIAPHNPDDLAMIEALQQENVHLVEEIAAIGEREGVTATAKAGDGEPAAAAESSTENISTALFDLNAEELATLKAMEDQLYKEVKLTDDSAVIDADLKEIAMIQEAEKVLTALEAGDSLDVGAVDEWENNLAAIEEKLKASGNLADEVTDGVTDV